MEVTFDNHGGERGMKRLLELAQIPTAVIASNDLIALGALQVANEMGYQVPKDISIMGIDDIYASSLSIPALTTMRKQKYEIGQKAAEILITRMGSGDEVLRTPSEIRLPCHLVVRGSTGPYLNFLSIRGNVQPSIDIPELNLKRHYSKIFQIPIEK